MVGMVPSFYLYGEPARTVDGAFLHLETLSYRSHPADGRIRPHRHGALNHVFLISGGAGVVSLDDTVMRFDGACLIFIPAGVVHSFLFAEGTQGYVLTLATSLLSRVLGQGPARQWLDGARLWPQEDEMADLLHLIRRMEREISWQALGREAVLESLLTVVLTDLTRQAQRFSQPQETGTAQQLLARFHALVEARYTDSLPLSVYLERLGVTETQLRYACHQAQERTPLQIIVERRLMEARRLLIYSDRSVAECGLSAGFSDPAYFTRLFTRRFSQTPKMYRLSRRQAEASPEFGPASVDSLEEMRRKSRSGHMSDH